MVFYVAFFVILSNALVGGNKRGSETEEQSGQKMGGN